MLAVYLFHRGKTWSHEAWRLRGFYFVFGGLDARRDETECGTGRGPPPPTQIDEACLLIVIFWLRLLLWSCKHGEHALACRRAWFQSWRLVLLHYWLLLMAWCHSYCLFLIFYSIYLHSSHSYSTVHWSVSNLRGSSASQHRWAAGCQPRIELTPALQLSDALPNELRRTLVSYAAQSWATPHPTDLCRTLLSHAAP